MKHYTALIIEDEPDDIELLKLELNKLDFKIDCTDVDSEAGLRASLNEALPDIVISDYSMPGFTGLDALKIVREQKSDLPFILCSGFIGEEQAVDAVKKGVTDYCLKNNLGRLGLSVERELKNYEDHKKKNQRLEETRHQYENILKSVKGIVWEADVETLEFLYVSPQAEQILGFSPEVWLGEPNFWEKHIHPDDREETIHYCHYKSQHGENHEFEYRMLDANGGVIWLRDYVTVVTEKGKPNRLSGLMIDISREKKAERQRDKAYEIANIGHWELDLVNDELYWSKAVKNIHEVDPNYEPDLETALEFYKEGEHRQEITRVVKNAIETGEPFEVELQIFTPNDNVKWVRVIGETEFHDGECKRIYGSTQDISERKEAFQERERILDRINEAFLATDQNWNVTYWNKQAQDVIGIKREDILGKNLWETFPEAKQLKFFQEYKRALKEQVSVQFEEYYPPLEEWLEVNVYPSEEGLSVFFRNITERKDAEKSLQELYQKNRLVLESTDEGLYGIDIKGRCTFINKAAANMLGYDSEECIGKNMHKLIHHKYSNGEIYPETECPIYISKNKHESCRVTDEVFWKADGTCFNVEYTSNPMIKDGKIKGGVVAFSDITKRKQHEKELQESLEEKETLLLEVHHRVKNNLAIISSLITLQMMEVEDENFRKILENTTSRVHSIAMVHELLYQSENFTEIPFEKYIKDLLFTIKKTIGSEKNNTELDIKVEVGGLNINQAIPLGLMLNELMTNSLKYAFTNRQEGKIIVRITRSDNNVKVVYEDNGEGYPDDTDFEDTDSFGHTLIQTLLKQLSEDYKVETKGKFRLEFQFEERKKGAHSNLQINNKS